MGLTDDVRRFYDDAPCDTTRGMALAPGWLAQAAVPDRSPFRAGARILMAGCGTGTGAAGFARSLPGAEVVGIDISEASIAKARQRSDRVRWEVGDLQDAEFMGRLGRFDLVICHAVADYVPSSERLVRNLGATLTEGGLLLLSTNTDAHPRERILRAWATLGGTLPWTGSPEQRALLATVGDLAGPLPGMPSLAELPDDVVRMDLFPPLAHHLAPHVWIELAEAAGLHLRGDRRVRDLVLADADLTPLLGLDLGALSRLAHTLVPAPSAMLLFGRRPPMVSRFSTELGGLAPVADATVPRDQLPTTTDGWDAPRSLTTIDGGISREVRVSALGMELLRRADGTHSLDQLAKRVGVAWEGARTDLFRLVHADLLRLDSPLTL